MRREMPTRRTADRERAMSRRTPALIFDFGNVVAHFDYRKACATLGRRDEAIACYRDALRHRPDYAEALCNLGLALTEAGLATADDADGARKAALWMLGRLRRTGHQGER